MRKSARAVQIRQRAYLHAQRLPHIGVVPRYVYTKLHTDDDFLSRIRESMNGPWAINGPHGATHTHPTGPSFPSLAPPLPPSPPASPRVHARALTRSLARLRCVLRRLKRRRVRTKLRRDQFYFFLAASFFSHGDSPGRREDRTPGYDLAATRPYVRAYVRTRVIIRRERESSSSWERLSRGRAKIA